MSAKDLGSQEAGSEEQDHESQRVCLLCGEVPDSIICLSCGHNIDIPCALRVIMKAHEDGETDANDISKIKCYLCGEVTVLSKEVQEAILNFEDTGGEEDDAQKHTEEEAQEEGENEQMADEDDGNEEEINRIQRKESRPIKVAERPQEKQSKSDPSQRPSAKKKSVRYLFLT